MPFAQNGLKTGLEPIGRSRRRKRPSRVFKGMTPTLACI